MLRKEGGAEGEAGDTSFEGTTFGDGALGPGEGAVSEVERNSGEVSEFADCR